MDFLVIIAVSLGIIFLLKRIITEPFQFWAKKGIPYLKPIIPIGNFAIFKNKSFVEIINDVYFSADPNSRFIGVYQFLQPLLLIRDPELVKELSIKEFNSFTDHRQFFPSDFDPLWNAGLVWMKGEKWRYMRNTLSPAFTGNKMRMLFGLMNVCTKQVVSYISEKSDSAGTFHAEMESVFKGYTNDVFATCAFGVNIDSLKNPNNEFYNKAAKAVTFRGLNLVKFFLCNLCPGIMKFFGVKMISDSTASYFAGIIEETLQNRRKNHFVRPDILHLLLEAQKGTLKNEETETQSEKEKCEITDQDIIGQSLLFVLGGFESVSILISFTFYELAVNPEMQKRLYDEIRESGSDSELNYEAIAGMKYLNMIISEVLRKWSPIPSTDRIANKEFVIKATNAAEKDCVIEKGFYIAFPVFSIHRDPKYFPEPERFDPERFSDENRSSFNHNAYMPFGMGPRFCIGSRFAILETKILVAHLLLNFEVVPIEKTPIPMVLMRGTLGAAAKGGMWLGFKRRYSMNTRRIIPCSKNEDNRT